jgi:hypothetical protein
MYDLQTAQAYIRRYGAIRPATKFVIIRTPADAPCNAHPLTVSKGPYIPITEAELPQFLKSGCTIVGDA